MNERINDCMILTPSGFIRAEIMPSSDPCVGNFKITEGSPKLTEGGFFPVLDVLVPYDVTKPSPVPICWQSKS